MRIILKWLAKLNVWYENLTEQKRFYIAFVYGLLPFITFVALAILSGETILNILGLLWIVIFVIAYRIWWLFGNLEKYLYD